MKSRRSLFAVCAIGIVTLLSAGTAIAAGPQHAILYSFPGPTGFGQLIKKGTSSRSCAVEVPGWIEHKVAIRWIRILELELIQHTLRPNPTAL